MTESRTPVFSFFEVFALASNRDDIPAVVSHFADPFLSAGPQGTQCISAVDFAAALPMRKKLFERLGGKPASLVSVEEMPLDARYVLAKTRWNMEFVREDLRPTELFLDSTFLVDTGADRIRIIMYMSHQDIMQAMKESGILKG